MTVKAIWSMDYDYITDNCYQRPCCPECEAPIAKAEDGKYHCFSCAEEVDVEDAEMLKWFADRDGWKEEMTDCIACGGKSCVKTHYYKNRVSLEWQCASGECKKCGARFIV